RHRLWLFVRDYRRDDPRRDRADLRLLARASAGLFDGRGDRPAARLEAARASAANVRPAPGRTAPRACRHRRWCARHAGPGARHRHATAAQSRALGEDRTKQLTYGCMGTKGKGMRLLARAALAGGLALLAGQGLAEPLPPGVSPEEAHTGCLHM